MIPVLRGHPRERKKGGYLGQVTQVYLHYILVKGIQKTWMHETSGPLIEVIHISTFDYTYSCCLYRGGESRDTLHLYSDGTNLNGRHYFFNTP